MLDSLYHSLREIHPSLLPISGVLLLFAAAWLADVLGKRQLVKFARRIAKRSDSPWDDLVIEHGVIDHLAQLLPAAVIFVGAPALPDVPEELRTLLRNLALAAMALLAVLTVNSLLSTLNAIYEQRPGANRRPIKGYIQLVKIVLFCVGSILIIAALLGKSPLLLLSGFGALTAVLLLVFKDTILSLVASVQLTSQDMVRVGDWIEMPAFNVDGDVIDVALHTVRVQNFDKTITAIPTHRLISDSFRNWRGMSDSGGRRIKRAILIDMASVRFLTPAEIEHFRRFVLLAPYIEHKEEELAQYNAALAGPSDADVNLRRLTNLGTLRAYLFSYLQNHPHIHKHMTLLVRQLAPQPQGIPIELYCFTTTTNWNDYEAIQGDIFDHILALLDDFGLRAYQQPSGQDLVEAGQPANYVAGTEGFRT